MSLASDSLVQLEPLILADSTLSFVTSLTLIFGTNQIAKQINNISAVIILYYVVLCQSDFDIVFLILYEVVCGKQHKEELACAASVRRSHGESISQLF